MTDHNDNNRDAHHFLVTAVEPAEARHRVAVTLVDARGGRVTLHLDEDLATALRNHLAQALG